MVKINFLASVALAVTFAVGANAAMATGGYPSTSQAEQAQQQISGVVVDASGQAIPGVSVMEKGTRNGVMTDLDGKFIIKVAKGATLEVSCVGYKTKDVIASDNLTVVLEEDAEVLEGTVVTALGIKRERKSLGYAVEDIGSTELMRNKTANAINSLSGKIAGVNVTQSSGAAGSGAAIILRGGTSGSETRDNQPLFVVDGVIYDNSSQVVGNTAFDGSGSAYTTSSNRVMDINPEDIENMSILKGPAAAALYGSKAANGVVLITTKRGKDGVVEVNLNTKYITSWAKTLPAVQNQYKRGYIETVNDAAGNLVSATQNDKSYNSWGEQYNGPWYDNVGNFFKTAGTWDTNLSVSGGTKNGNFFLSASHYNQDGIVPQTGYDKTTFRFNGEQKFLDIFTVSVNTAYSKANTDRTLTSGGLYGSSGTGALAAVYMWAPSDDMTHYLNEDDSRYKLGGNDFAGLLDPWDERNNPYWIINKDSYTDHTERFTGSINLRADITPWWFINYRAGIDTYNQSNDTRVAANGVVKQVWQKGMLSNNQLKYTYMSHNLMSNFSGKTGIGTQAELTLGRILTQKRIALQFSIEQWNDMRRYDYNKNYFLGWGIAAFHYVSAAAMKSIPEGKFYRRWRQCSHEYNYNSKNLIAIGLEVPGADNSLKNWNRADDAWTIPVWWDSDQQ